MPQVKHEEPRVSTEDPLTGKVRRFLTLKGRITDLAVEQDEIKKELSELVDSTGTPDEKGNIWLSLPEEIDGIISLQRQRKTSRSLDESYAERILRKKGLYDRCYKMVPVLDEGEVMAAHYDGLISEEEIDEMFPTKVSYAFIPSKK